MERVPGVGASLQCWPHRTPPSRAQRPRSSPGSAFLPPSSPRSLSRPPEPAPSPRPEPEPERGQSGAGGGKAAVSGDPPPGSVPRRHRPRTPAGARGSWGPRRRAPAARLHREQSEVSPGGGRAHRRRSSPAHSTPSSLVSGAADVPGADNPEPARTAGRPVPKGAGEPDRAAARRAMRGAQ